MKENDIFTGTWGRSIHSRNDLRHWLGEDLSLRRDIIPLRIQVELLYTICQTQSETSYIWRTLISIEPHNGALLSKVTDFHSFHLLGILFSRSVCTQRNWEPEVYSRALLNFNQICTGNTGEMRKYNLSLSTFLEIHIQTLPININEYSIQYQKKNRWNVLYSMLFNIFAAMDRWRRSLSFPAPRSVRGASLALPDCSPVLVCPLRAHPPQDDPQDRGGPRKPRCEDQEELRRVDGHLEISFW